VAIATSHDKKMTADFAFQTVSAISLFPAFSKMLPFFLEENRAESISKTF
jgi:hypothetical protein